MRIVLFLLIYLLGVASAALAGDLALEDLQQANAVLQAELDLARSGKPYILIDLQENRLQLRASGLALQSWGIDYYRRWGRPSAVPAVNLLNKSSLEKPERNIQEVNAVEAHEEEGGKPFKALEVAEMPTSYVMHLVNGTAISVRSTPVAWYGQILSVFQATTWYLSRPLISNWNFLRSSPYNELALSMPAQDARTLYWAFIEGTPCLIRLPAEVSTETPAAIGTNR